ncbi:hypothetical protein [Roseomonas sp. USHLN139]|uniref:hypothetical protein n=1 Tax=Roseomonas sp. USHLN139 TaxID=3081298 RepID=UPI003B019C3D
MLPVSAVTSQQGLMEFWAQLRARAEQAAQTAGGTTTDSTADPATTAPGTVVAPGVATPDSATRYSDETEALLVALQSGPGSAPPPAPPPGPPPAPPPGGPPPAAAADGENATGAIAALKALLEALQAQAEEEAQAGAAGVESSPGDDALAEAQARNATPPEASPIGQVQGLLQSIVGQLQADQASGAERRAEAPPEREADPDRGFRQRALAEAARAYAAQQEEGPGATATSIFV